MYDGLIQPNLMKPKVVSEFTAVRSVDCDNNQHSDSICMPDTTVR